MRSFPARLRGRNEVAQNSLPAWTRSSYSENITATFGARCVAASFPLPSTLDLPPPNVLSRFATSLLSFNLSLSFYIFFSGSFIVAPESLLA